MFSASVAEYVKIMSDQTNKPRLQQLQRNMIAGLIHLMSLDSGFDMFSRVGQGLTAMQWLHTIEHVLASKQQLLQENVILRAELAEAKRKIELLEAPAKKAKV